MTVQWEAQIIDIFYNLNHPVSTLVYYHTGIVGATKESESRFSFWWCYIYQAIDFLHPLLDNVSHTIASARGHHYLGLEKALNNKIRVFEQKTLNPEHTI